MAPFLETIKMNPDDNYTRNWYQRIHSAIDRLILGDIRALLQPGQSATPLVLSAVLGTLLSFMPAPILDTLLVGIIFARFRQINRSALLAARLVWNDFVVVPLYVPGYRFGMSLLDPYVVGGSTLTARAGAFSLGLLALTLSAAIISAAVMFIFITLLGHWRGSSA